MLSKWTDKDSFTVWTRDLGKHIATVHVGVHNKRIQLWGHLSERNEDGTWGFMMFSGPEFRINAGTMARFNKATFTTFCTRTEGVVGATITVTNGEFETEAGALRLLDELHQALRTEFTEITVPA